MCSRRRLAALPVALLMVLAGCGSAGTGTTPSAGTLTPAPVPTADGLVGGTPTPDRRVGAYAIGPTEPLCPSEVGEEGKDYPETVSRELTVAGNWSNGTEAAHLAERAASGVAIGGASPELVPVPGGQRRVTLLGETFDPAERFEVDRYALATSRGNRSLDAIVLPPDGNRTTVHLYALTGFC